MQVIGRPDVDHIDILPGNHRLPVGLGLFPTPASGKLLHDLRLAGASDFELEFVRKGEEASQPDGKRSNEPAP